MWPWKRTAQAELQEADIPYVKEEGIIVLHDDGLDAIADVCFVHGLGGHRIKTWSKDGCCWPKELLPNTFSQRGVKIRVVSFGYDADPIKWKGGANHEGVQAWSRSLMQHLADYREDLGGEHCNRPIVFVGHSLGGLVIKGAVSQAQQYNVGEAERNIFDCTFGVVFLGTPHHGSNLTAWTRYAQGIFAIAQRAPNKDLIDILTPDTTQLKVLSESFDNVSGGIPKYCCYETKSTRIAGMDFGLIVNETSATMNGARRVAITTNHTDMCKFNSEEDPNYHAATRGIKKFVGQIQELNEQQNRATAEEFQRMKKAVLASLRDSVLFQRGESITEAETKTFQWLMEPIEDQQSKFIDFLRGNDTIFWISGKPGAGKSTLMKYLLEHPALRTHLSAWSGGEHYATAAFFFLKRGKPLQKSLEGLLRSLLYQLLDQVPEILPIMQGRKAHSKSWTVNELIRAFMECMQKISRAFLCIDGLDEYVSTRDASVQANFAEDRDDDYQEIIRFIGRFTAKNPGLKLCVSSRPYEEFSTAFKDFQSLQLHELTKDDILAYIDHHFDTIKEDRWRFTLVSGRDRRALLKWDSLRKIWKTLSPRKLLREEISKNSSGVFLWVRLVVDRIKQQIRRAESNLTDMIEYLRKSKGELDNLFDDMFDDILEGDREEGLIYIQMLQRIKFQQPKPTIEFLACGSYPTFAERIVPTQNFPEEFGKLTVEQLRTMEDRKMIRLEKCCGQFIEIIQGTVHLVHQTVAEYFADERVHQKYSIDVDEVKIKADRFALASIIFQLWNPEHLRAPLECTPRPPRPYDWVYEVTHFGTECIKSLLKKEGNTDLLAPFLKAASTPQLVSWAYQIPGQIYTDIYGESIREQPFSGFCQLVLWCFQSLNNPTMELPELGSCPSVEMLFQLTAGVPVPPLLGHRAAMILDNSELRKKLFGRPRGSSSWERCLVMLVFFHHFHMRPHFIDPGLIDMKYTQEIGARRPGDHEHDALESAAALHEYVVELIEEGADPFASVNIHPLCSQKWGGVQPIWALYHLQQSEEGAYVDLKEEESLPAVKIIERVFGRGSEAWKLLREKGAPFEEDAAASRIPTEEETLTKRLCDEKSSDMNRSDRRDPNRRKVVYFMSSRGSTCTAVATLNSICFDWKYPKPPPNPPGFIWPPFMSSWPQSLGKSEPHEGASEEGQDAVENSTLAGLPESNAVGPLSPNTPEGSSGNSLYIIEEVGIERFWV